ncbi:tetratricopeptide repeat protein [Halopseudomonas sp.]|uniref:tetratricopeptide repeat protein n=1 Tax=Halopseudomonas sp. TaxID=2901191 RepID=UPI003569F8D5
MVFSTSRKGGRGASPGAWVILGILCILPGAVVASIGTTVVVPAGDAVVLSRDDTAMATAASTALPAPVLSPDRLVQALRALVEQSRASGSPRPLGLAAGLMDRLPASQWTAEVYLMRATIHQRLHRFDLAEEDLDRVLDLEPENRQAWLTRYSIALVRGDLDSARRACERLQEGRAGLVADSCRQELASFGEQPEQAYEQLTQALGDAGSSNAIERDYALVTQAEMATRLQLREAGELWQRSLLRDPADLYRRARYADWLLSQGRDQEVMVLTRGFEAVDTLAVLRAVAMTRLQHPQQLRLVGDLEERFAEARWRGEFLHEWEYARFLLDVKNDAQAALAAAQANWETQRAPVDRLVLRRAAMLAGQPSGIDETGYDNKSTL